MELTRFLKKRFCILQYGMLFSLVLFTCGKAPAPEKIRLHFECVNQLNQPLAGIRLVIAGSHSLNSDALGQASLELPPGAKALSLAVESDSPTLQFSGGDSVYALGGTTSYLLDFFQQSEIHFRVFKQTEDGEQPCLNVPIRQNQRVIGQTNSDGEFIWTWPDEQNDELRFNVNYARMHYTKRAERVPGQFDYNVDFAVQESEPGGTGDEHLPPPEPENYVVIQAFLGINQPLEGVEILKNGERLGQTDAFGRYRIRLNDESLFSTMIKAQYRTQTEEILLSRHRTFYKIYFKSVEN